MKFYGDIKPLSVPVSSSEYFRTLAALDKFLSVSQTTHLGEAPFCVFALLKHCSSIKYETTQLKETES